jgi:hypothetical protein
MPKTKRPMKTVVPKPPPPPTPTPEEFHATLEAKLLAIGGTGVVWQDHEPHLALLVASGRLFEESVTLKKGRKSQCHTNAAGMWSRDVDYNQLATGYALNDDGLWRQHSWVISGKTLYETTTPRTKYFGVILEGTPAMDFWFTNYVMVEFPGLLDYWKNARAMGR